MDGPSELSLSEIRKFMLENGCKVTNHALVKNFKRFLTNPDTQNESRKQFKTYVNILATIKNENNQKYLILRKKYLNECPSEDIVDLSNPGTPMSPGGASLSFEPEGSPLRQPPPYKPPPQVSPMHHQVKVPVLQSETKDNYKECISEFEAAVSKIDPSRFRAVSADLEAEDENGSSQSGSSQTPPSVPPRKRSSVERSMSRESSVDENKENYEKNAVTENASGDKLKESENSISVKEATRKFNRLASEEEAKILSPSPKKKPEKEKILPAEEKPAEVTLAHPKAKEWIVSAAKANYQDLAKLASDYPELVKLQDPTTGYTALHWAAKHGNEDVVKLIAGTYKVDVHARTNGGYTPLHLAMQFGKENIFDLLVNVYKANRDLTDWSGNKPLDYSQQKTSVSASTYSKIKARRKQSEKDLGFLRIGSLNVRVKKTTEAFSNFLGVGSGNTTSTGTGITTSLHHHPSHQSGGMMTGTAKMRGPGHHHLPAHMRASAPPTGNLYDPTKIHKSWGSADNIPHNDKDMMPPPKDGSMKKRRTKRTTDTDQNSAGYSSMPATPNQLRSPIGSLSEQPTDSDSDSAFGFDSSWSVKRGSNVASSDGAVLAQKPPTYI